MYEQSHWTLLEIVYEPDSHVYTKPWTCCSIITGTRRCDEGAHGPTLQIGPSQTLSRPLCEICSAMVWDCLPLGIGSICQSRRSADRCWCQVHGCSLEST